MRIAVGSDETGPAPESVVAELRSRGDLVVLSGALAGSQARWADIGRDVAERVAQGEADAGVLFCWTGTGVSIAANKVRGARAALCVDAETARGARAWNDANVLCMSLRITTPALAREILYAFLDAAPDGSETDQIVRLERDASRQTESE